MALVVGALLAVPATPALAAQAVVQPSSITVNAGSDATVTVVISPGPNDKGGDISLTGLPSGVSCANGCGNFQFNGPPGSPKTQLLTLKANDNAPDANTTVTVRVVPDASDPATPTFSLTVKAKPAPAPTQAETVKLISGKVVNATNGDPVPGATVMLLDSQQHKYSTSSDSSGNYRFSGSSTNPITPGRIELGAMKGNINATKSVNASAGQSLTGQRISLDIKVAASPSATPSASDAALPTDEATDEATTEETAAEGAAGQQATANEDSGSSWLLILLGGLFVAVGVGTIVLLYMRRKNDGDDTEDGDGPVGPAAGVGPVPGARGAYRGADDQTRVVNGMGAGAAPTMVGGASLSDAPTMMHRPVVDDVPPDPYGAPPPAYGAGGQPGWAGSGYGDEAPGQGGYGGNGYGNAPSSGGGYGNAPSSGGGYGNAPSSDGGYGSRDHGAGAGGYPPAQGGYGERYDEPTGRYPGDGTQSYAPPADPYPTSTYQPPTDQGRGYGQDAGQYGRAPEPTNGYGAGGGYGAPAGGGYDNGPASGGYGGGQQQGYDGYGQQGGYGEGYGQQGGYGQPGGYGQEPPQQRGGGYDQGGYHGDPAQTGRGRSDGPGQERGGRRLDWLDD
ncbi:carboxypeptidase regulatory-like domain-containing protein [Micromonospora globispora]|uniref:carboxypeptidase regulatory-like domain-containing protein n=1 Tax=Micromonospora globispora TaxID=1450148 RepID=UPI001FAF6430|nr:carboxypeptidase regulatory-like domain-containing protein [Micromonospora globispora]